MSQLPALHELVAKFFADNPEEVLTIGDVAAKFSYTVNSVPGMLKPGIKSGTIAASRIRIDGVHLRCYKAGPNLFAPAQAAPAAAPAKPAPAAKPAPSFIDLSGVQLEDLPEAPQPTQLQECISLLARMKAGQRTQPLPITLRSTMAKAITRQHKALPGSAYMQISTQGFVRVQRNK